MATTTITDDFHLSEESRLRAKTSEPIRVALIGCGAISQQMHLPVLAGRDDVQLSVLVDRDAARAERFAKGYGVGQTLADASSLTRELVDAAVIATPPIHHAPCAIALMRKGIHVLVEKPMATNFADAQEMVAEAKRAGVALSVGYYRRLFPSVALLKSLVDSGWAGRPLSFLVEGGGMYGWSAATLGNMQRDSAGGGVLMDFGSHMIDLLFAIFDEPAELHSYRDNSLGGIEADCSLGLSVQHLEQPIVGQIELARNRQLGSFIRVECEEATLEFQISERHRIKIVPRNLKLQHPISGEVLDGSFDAAWQGESTDESWYATFAREFDDWLSAIRCGGEPILSGRSALRTAQLIEKCYVRPKTLRENWVWHGIDSSASGSVRNDGQIAGFPVHACATGGRVLVTGATGFIGCRVVELLKLRERCDVRAVVHNPANASRLARLDVEMVQADLSNAEDVRQILDGCETIIHCAIGTTYGEPRKIADVTVGGTQRLVKAALTQGVQRFVHVSSMSVYGRYANGDGQISESAPVCPLRNDSYGQSKADAERVVFDGARQGLPAVVVRPARVFGAFSHTFITNPLRAIAAHEFGWLGSPDVAADLVFVDNVAELLLKVAFAERASVAGEAFNIGAGDAASWRAFYEFFSEQLNLDLANIATVDVVDAPKRSAWLHPGGLVRGVGTVIKSAEFKSLGRRVLATDPIGTMPRATMERFPSLERGLRSLIGADDSLPIYRPDSGTRSPTVLMGSDGVRLSNDKMMERLAWSPPVSSTDALELTLDWVRHARIV